jgi:O-antigen ligase
MLEKFKKINWLWFLPVIAVLHLVSFAAMTWPLANTLGFVIIAGLALVLAIIDLRLAILLLFLELLVGSKGYLFSLPVVNFDLSIRIALWSIIMSVWAIKFLGDFKKNWQDLKNVLWSRSGKYFLALLLACAVSVVIGLVNNKVDNLFFDANNWIFLLLALPLWTSFKTKADLDLLLKTFVIGVTWLASETLILAYIFSHDLGVLPLQVYAWLRRTGLAEITWTPNGFWRIFLQSQLYLVPAFVGLQMLAGQEKLRSKKALIVIAQATLVLAALFFSLSRSLWLGLAAALLMMASLALPKWSQIGRQLTIFVITALTTSGLVMLVLTGLGGGRALFDRANIMTEAAAYSRWNLLPVITQKIMTSPVFGRGFGATVTYQSADPRVLEKDPSGAYETYAFEWGWLDLWLKLGLWGMMIYLAWLVCMIRDLLKLKKMEATWLAVSLIALMAVHFFTPYLNHPLGLIIVIISAQALRIWQSKIEVPLR